MPNQTNLYLITFVLLASLSGCGLAPLVVASSPATSPATLSLTSTPSPLPYVPAMLPAFAADVDQVAAAGATLYDLQVDLAPLANGEWGLTGVEQIQYTNTETVPLSEIYFILYPNLPGYDGLMQVESVSVNGQAVQPTLKMADSALHVSLPQPLAPGETVNLRLTYTALVPAQTDEGYNIFSASDGTLALAGFYPAIAVYDDTGWNFEIPPSYGDATYLDTSLYQVELNVPADLVVAASGSTLERRVNDDKTQTLSLVSGPMRDFYLAARPDFKIVSQIVDDVLVNSYYRPGQKAGGQLALRYAADSLRVFNRLFGPYPYAELDVVATPTTAGGVEYPGIIVLAQGLYDEEGGFFEHATVHEVAHQWWYGLVGNDQVDHPWLDEALTNYSTLFYWEEIKGQTGAAQLVEILFEAPYQRAKEAGYDRAVIGPVADFSEPNYGAIVYGKGPLFFHALRQQVGDETYLEIMRSYLSRYKYKHAQPDDLLTLIEQVSGQKIEPLIETWLKNK
jgi:hypothetical protein